MHAIGFSCAWRDHSAAKRLSARRERILDDKDRTLRTAIRSLTAGQGRGKPDGEEPGITRGPVWQALSPAKGVARRRKRMAMATTPFAALMACHTEKKHRSPKT
jgi:hypothetical protein